jgi:hypothetical protein
MTDRGGRRELPEGIEFEDGLAGHSMPFDAYATVRAARRVVKHPSYFPQ